MVYSIIRFSAKKQDNVGESIQELRDVSYGRTLTLLWEILQQLTVVSLDLHNGLGHDGDCASMSLPEI